MSRKLKFRTKLCLYFVLFAVIIFAVLWLLQTVFLQSFYNNMLAERTRSAAQEIAAAGSDYDRIDMIARDSSLLVFVTDVNGNIFYSTDEYKSNYRSTGNAHNENPYRKNEELNYQYAVYRNLPEGYFDFLTKLDNDGGITEYSTGTLFVYGKYIPEEKVLYVSTPLDPVGAAAGIIQTQLLLVTGASIVIAAVLAYFISRRFARPVSALSEQAKKLGQDDFAVNSGKPFCAEISELGDTLKSTDLRLREAKTYQQELLANISHDLRTPLTMIRGYAESIRDFGDDEKQRIEDSEIIIKETERLNALVSEILEYSELQANGADTAFENVDISSLVISVIRQFEPLFQSQGGLIEHDVTEGLSVNGDTRQLERVVYNLIDNAIRHTDAIKKITVTLGKENDRIRLTVQDYGSGIPEDRLPHIWERYYTYRQRNKQGVSGLGLAIVKQIVNIHGGNCFVRSKVGSGSCFVVEF